MTGHDRTVADFGAAMKPKMPGALATCLGFLAASATPPAVIALLAAAQGSLGGALGGFVFFYIYSGPLTLLLAVPTYLLLRLFAPARSRWVLGIGVSFGIAIGAGIAIAVEGTPLFVACYAAMGAASGLAFWLVWRLGLRDARA